MQLTMKGVFLVFFFVAGCAKSIEPNTSLARIIINDNIDGVKLGDDYTTVIQKIGEPSSTVFPGRPAVMFVYNEGVHATMSIIIYQNATPSGVRSITVSSPYQGKTQEGIAVGSSRSYVLSKLGNPTESVKFDSVLFDRYILDKSIFQIAYDTVFVRSLALLAKN